MGVIFHLPHSSASIPEEYLSDFVLSGSDLTEELRLMTDWHTSGLFSPAVHALGTSIEFPVSRLLVDPERFPDDGQELMSEVGMGVLYRKTSQGKQLRAAGTDQGSRRYELLQHFYDPHHDALTHATEMELSRSGSVLIVDCHSFPAQALPYEFDQASKRPDICIGTDDFHTAGQFADEIAHEYRSLGYSVALNTPFAGALVPLKYYKEDRSVQSIMIEVNRSLYMDEKSTKQNEQFGKVSSDIRSVLSMVVSRENFSRY
jgi:N-formylglutamate deformylase